MVLVRSIDVSQIPSTEDIKIPIIAFFSNSTTDNQPEEVRSEPALSTSCTREVKTVLESMLSEKGYMVRKMGVVWNDAICVENEANGQRAALGIEGAGESMDAWRRMVSQQKVTERVGWKTFRVDASAFLLDHHSALGVLEINFAGFFTDVTASEGFARESKVSVTFWLWQSLGLEGQRLC
jgi:hypothetical protein